MSKARRMGEKEEGSSRSWRGREAPDTEPVPHRSLSPGWATTGQWVTGRRQAGGGCHLKGVMQQQRRHSQRQAKHTWGETGQARKREASDKAERHSPQRPSRGTLLPFLGFCRLPHGVSSPGRWALLPHGAGGPEGPRPRAQQHNGKLSSRSVTIQRSMV